MGIFARLATLIKSNLNDLISRSEDPEKMLNQVVIDMANQLIEAKKQPGSCRIRGSTAPGTPCAQCFAARWGKNWESGFA